ncbi:hypothetical protein [Oceanithermus sp.]|uniref:IPT/TIG domain-containing protein n=1 Tax=Oceanithermus profundus TaxID=187137 RepID=A0A7C5WRX3_9DEIN|nr:hypothetical protein [Oceanithermus sp.]HHO57635.1 hypothetical protein [Oceanithermus profundus]
MKKGLWTLLGLFTLLVLAACSTQTGGIRTTGALKVLSAVPDVTAGCPVRAGDWMALTGNNFGTQADWDDGPNYLLFPPEPGLAPERVELTQAQDPATLFFMVPAGAQSGTVRLHVEGVGDAEFTVTIASGAGASTAVPGCELPTPPAP